MMHFVSAVLITGSLVLNYVLTRKFVLEYRYLPVSLRSIKGGTVSLAAQDFNSETQGVMNFAFKIMNFAFKNDESCI